MDIRVPLPLRRDGPASGVARSWHETDAQGHTRSAWLQCEITTLDETPTVWQDHCHVELDPHHAN
jgi:hypothetical protein